MSKPLHKSRTAFNAALFVFLSIGALGFANVISLKHFGRIDLTKDKIYTLAGASRDLVAKLPDRMNVKLFMSEDLKPPFKQHAQFARDLLAEYATYSQGKFNLEVIKIGEGDEARKKEEEATKCGVQKSNRGVVSANKFEIGATFLGVCFAYGDKTEAIPVIDRDEGLEFMISGLIKQMTVKKKKIGFTTGQGELGSGHGGGLQLLSEQLKASGYETINVELKAMVSSDIDLLLVIGAKQPFSERAKYVLDQFLMSGKSVAFLIDGQQMQTPRGQMAPGMEMPQIAQNNDVGLDDLLGAYGVKIKQDMVLDKRNFPGLVNVGQQMYLMNHPVFLKVTPLPQVHAVNENMPGALLSYASSVELVGDAKDGKVGAVCEDPVVEQPKLASVGSVCVHAGSEPDATDTERGSGPFTLGVIGQASSKSAFAGKPIVKEDGTKIPADQSQPGVEPMKSEAQNGARLVVIGDSDFIGDQFIGTGARAGLRDYLANLVYTMNIIDWLAQDEALAAVRKKGMQSRPLDQVSESTVTLVKLVNIGALPGLILLIGLIRFRIRQSARQSAKL
ncbi:MAG: GldG family protein [Polyangia bacterium]